ncbi:hypothetical protein [Vibrio vulnificus YJ016]|uniref:Uncharacterized protein n=2 Tax=Vibrionaceae TaxID=641 RepID=Q7MKC9_VIBVY|nr:hypothetical protein [Vibrio vulnificus YJ016]
MRHSPLNAALGFRNEMAAKSKKINLAKEQLEDGIDLYFRGRYVSALTLLGAADEIFCGMLLETQGYSAVDNDWRFNVMLRTYYDTPHLSKGEVKKITNRAKNTVKHHDKGDPLELHFDRQGNAYMMLFRAVSHAEMLSVKFIGRRRFYAWATREYGVKKLPITLSAQKA